MLLALLLRRLLAYNQIATSLRSGGMATKKERLANKREAQKAKTARLKAQQEKERLTKEKDDQDETKKLDAKIQQLDKDIRALAEAASDYRSKQEFLSFRCPLRRALARSW